MCRGRRSSATQSPPSSPPSTAETVGASLGLPATRQLAFAPYRMPYGTIVTAEGDGPGTHVVWALHLESRNIIAAAMNSFGRWDESDVLLETLIPEALAAVSRAGS